MSHGTEGFEDFGDSGVQILNRRKRRERRKAAGGCNSGGLNNNAGTALGCAVQGKGENRFKEIQIAQSGAVGLGNG
jgi:hypothetical protein